MRDDKLLGLMSGALFIATINYYTQQNKLDELKLINSDLLKQYKSLKEKCDRYSNSGSTSYEAANSLVNIKEQLSKTNFELMKSQDALTKVLITCKSLESANASLNMDKRNLTTELFSLEETVNIKQLALIEAKKRNELLRRQNENPRIHPQYKLTLSNEDLARQNEILKQQVFSHQIEISNLKSKIILLSNNLMNSQNGLANATLKLNGDADKYNELHNKYIALESNYSVLYGQHKQSITQIATLQRLKDELARLQKDKQEKEIELRASYTDLEGLHKTYAQDKKRLEDMIVLLKSKLQQIRDGELEMPIKPKAKI